MSATNRGAVRNARDLYVTPAWCVDRLLDDILPRIAVARPDGIETWLEPCVGTGAIVNAVDAYYEARGFESPQWKLSDIHPDVPEGWEAETLDYAATAGPVFRHSHGLPMAGHDFIYGRFDVGITNPPFYCAERIIRNMMHDCRLVLALLRVNFLGSEERTAWLQACEPGVRVLPNRPSFEWHGQTDATEYAWFLFTHANDMHYWGDVRETIRVLNTTPDDIRKAQRPIRPPGAMRPGKRRKAA